MNMKTLESQRTEFVTESRTDQSSLELQKNTRPGRSRCDGGTSFAIGGSNSTPVHSVAHQVHVHVHVSTSAHFAIARTLQLTSHLHVIAPCGARAPASLNGKILCSKLSVSKESERIRVDERSPSDLGAAATPVDGDTLRGPGQEPADPSMQGL